MKNLHTFIIVSLLAFHGLVDARPDRKAMAKEFEGYLEKLTVVEGTTPSQWRVIWTGDGSSEAVVSWTTAEAGKTHTLYYDTEPHGVDVSKYKHQQDCQLNALYTKWDAKNRKTGELVDKGTPAYYHHAILEGLKPSTAYYFVMKSDDEVSRQLYFITAPSEGTGFSVLCGGDSRSGHIIRCRMNVMMAEMIEKDQSILALIHGGDYIKEGRAWSQWRLWLSHHELTTASDGRVLPVVPARGNHDHIEFFQEVFNIPKGGPNWHTTMLGKDVAVVTLDTCVPAGGDQAKWLEGELSRLRPETTWLLTQYHYPMFPAVKEIGRHSPIFVPLFEKYNVGLACESDGHCIKRTVPIRDGKKDPTGVTYIGEGGFGAPSRYPKDDRWYLNEGGAAGTGSHVMLLDFTDETLRIRTILGDGEIFDDHTLKVRK